MQVILLERVAKLGNMGDVVSVKDGYARNFLLPQKKALWASQANIDAFETDKADLEKRNEETKADAQHFPSGQLRQQAAKAPNASRTTIGVKSASSIRAKRVSIAVGRRSITTRISVICVLMFSRTFWDGRLAGKATSSPMSSTSPMSDT